MSDFDDIDEDYDFYGNEINDSQGSEGDDFYGISSKVSTKDNAVDETMMLMGDVQMKEKPKETNREYIQNRYGIDVNLKKLDRTTVPELLGSVTFREKVFIDDSDEEDEEKELGKIINVGGLNYNGIQYENVFYDRDNDKFIFSRTVEVKDEAGSKNKASTAKSAIDSAFVKIGDKEISDELDEDSIRGLVRLITDNILNESKLTLKRKDDIYKFYRSILSIAFDEGLLETKPQKLFDRDEKKTTNVGIVINKKNRYTKSGDILDKFRADVLNFAGLDSNHVTFDKAPNKNYDTKIDVRTTENFLKLKGYINTLYFILKNNDETFELARFLLKELIRQGLETFKFSDNLSEFQSVFTRVGAKEGVSINVNDKFDRDDIY